MYALKVIMNIRELKEVRTIKGAVVVKAGPVNIYIRLMLIVIRVIQMTMWQQGNQHNLTKCTSKQKLLKIES